MNNIAKCPVCGKEKNSQASSQYKCEACGFNYAYMRYFASARSYEFWKNIADKNKMHTYATSNRLLVGSNLIAFRDIENRKVYIVHDNGRIQIENNAKAVSASERNYSVLYYDGLVRVFGEDNSCGQKNTESWKGIRLILSAPNCTYGVDDKGSLVYAGIPAEDLDADWSNMVDLKASANSIIGVNADGKTRIAGTFMNRIGNASTKEWPYIKQVYAARNCVVGLTSDNTIKFLGKKDDPRRDAENWNEVIAVAVDNAYIYGLSAEGKLNVAGKCSPLLDNGRSNVNEWENIIAFDSNQSGIGAIDKSGRLLFAGTISGDIDIITESWTTVWNRL